MKKYLFVVFGLISLSVYSQTREDQLKLVDYVYQTFTDSRDGNTYKYVKIGTQYWMAENLKATKYTNGTEIPNVTSDDIWGALNSGAFCWYKNDPGINAETYGALYNWYALASLCPVGWHIPVDYEWAILENYLIANGYNCDGTTTGNKIAKSMASKTVWESSDIIGSPGKDLATNNKCGFGGLPGGYRSSDGSFSAVSNAANWWSYTEYSNINKLIVWCRSMSYNTTGLYRSAYSKRSGFSVRCIKN